MVKEKTRTEEEVEILEEDEILTEKSYAVIIHNDEVTPTPIVFLVLIDVFGLDSSKTIGVIEMAEKNGKAMVKGGYTFSQAMEDVNKAKSLTRSFGLDLKFTIEEEN